MSMWILCEDVHVRIYVYIYIHIYCHVLQYFILYHIVLYHSIYMLVRKKHKICIHLQPERLKFTDRI